MSKIEDGSKNISTVVPFPDLDPTKEPLKKKVIKERETWSGQFDFFVSALGYAVGVGNVWRFPYLCYNNGGGAFLIPYFLCMCFIAIPLCYLEMTVGQFTSNSSIAAWKMVKIFKGIGLGMNISNFLLTIYYNMIIGYSIYYLFASFTTELPWVKCHPQFSSNNCVDDYSDEHFVYTKCDNVTGLLKCDDEFNFGRCFNATAVNGTIASCGDSRDVLQQVGWWKTSFPSQDFWNKQVLEKSDSIGETGSFVWPLCLALLVAWVLVYLIVIKGIKSSGKIAWFTAIFPYIVLLILGIRGWMLPGAYIGIEFYVYPKWERLLEIGVWRDAAVQTFFTLSLCYGGLPTLASYNKFNHKIWIDAISIPVMNCLSSFFAGFIIFSYMGYLSYITHQDISNIIQAGQGLAFVVYPYALTTITAAPIWSCLFFIMMLLLGLDSTMTCVETTVTSFMDAFPSIKNVGYLKYSAITLMCIGYFCLGLIFCFQSGAYWMEFFNFYVGDYAVLILGITECITVAYFYRLKNFQTDIDCINGHKNTSWTKYIWWSMWSFFTPIVIAVVTTMSLSSDHNIKLGNYVFPEWSMWLGTFVTMMPLIGFLLVMAWEIVDTLLVKRRSALTLFVPDFEAYQPLLEDNKRIVRKAREKVQELEQEQEKKFSENIEEISKEERF